MFVSEITEGKDDAEHFDALEKTGFFGNKGAGCIFFAKDTCRFLIMHRSRMVEQPGDWGNVGGAIDSKEDPQKAVKREAYEEVGYSGDLKLVPLFVFSKGNFRYYNFLAVIEKEFTPRLDWESQGYKWCEYGKWPKPLHFGLISLFNDPKSAEIMKKYALKQIDENIGHNGAPEDTVKFISTGKSMGKNMWDIIYNDRKIGTAESKFTKAKSFGSGSQLASGTSYTAYVLGNHIGPSSKNNLIKYIKKLFV